MVLSGGRTLDRLGEDVKTQHEDYEVAVDLKTYLSEKKRDGMEEVQETKNQLEEIKRGILHLEAGQKSPNISKESQSCRGSCYNLSTH